MNVVGCLWDTKALGLLDCISKASCSRSSCVLNLEAPHSSLASQMISLKSYVPLRDTRSGKWPLTEKVCSWRSGRDWTTPHGLYHEPRRPQHAKLLAFGNHSSPSIIEQELRQIMRCLFLGCGCGCGLPAPVRRGG